MKFSDQAEKRIEEIFTRYPTRRAALLPLLWIAQEEFGWVSPEAMELVAEKLDLSPAHVYGVVTFYTMLHRTPIGRYHLQVCRTLPCALMGCEKIWTHLKKRLEIQEGETTQDGKFTLSSVECIASCGTGPVVMVNDRYHEGLTPEKLDRLLEALK